MIGPAEIEDMRLDLADAERDELYDEAIAPLHRYWAQRGSPSVGTVSQICDALFSLCLDRPVTAWKSVLVEAMDKSGYGVLWNGNEVAAIDRHAPPTA